MERDRDWEEVCGQVLGAVIRHGSGEGANGVPRGRVLPDARMVAREMGGPPGCAVRTRVSPRASPLPEKRPDFLVLAEFLEKEFADPISKLRELVGTQVEFLVP